MDDSDTLPDIVLNKPVPNVANDFTFNDKLPLSRSSPIPSDVEMTNNEEFVLTTHPSPEEPGKMPGSAALETTTSAKSSGGTTTSRNDSLHPADETINNTNEVPVAESNDPASNVSKIMSDKNISETEAPPLPPPPPPPLSPKLPSSGIDTEDSEIHQTTVITNTSVDVAVQNEIPEQNELLGVTAPSEVPPTGFNLSSGTGNANEKPMDVDTHNEPNESLHGVTMTRNFVTAPLHGKTDLNLFDHNYSRQTNDSLITNPDYYTTIEDEDGAIEGLLQLIAAENTRPEFPGDNSQLLPIGAHLPDATPVDINLETVAVMAVIENIALEETVTKTTSTVSTQTTFTRQRPNRPIELSDSDSDDDSSRKPTMHSQAKTGSKKAKFKTVKYGIKKRRSSRTYACKE